MKAISQREARHLRRRVIALENAESVRRKAWRRDYPGGIEIARQNVQVDTLTAVVTARKLGHAVIAIESDNELRFVALPHPSAEIV
jgi:hypothetical protein